MARVIFVCTGNTCRSPLAEVFARDAFGQIGIVFESVGLQVVGRHSASEESLQIAAEQGLDLSAHCSSQVSREQLQDTIWLIGMTRSHAAIARSRYCSWYDGKTGVLGAPGLDLNELAYSPDCEEVDDPFGESLISYELAAKQIQRLVLEWGPVFSGLNENRE